MRHGPFYPAATRTLSEVRQHRSAFDGRPAAAAHPRAVAEAVATAVVVIREIGHGEIAGSKLWDCVHTGVQLACEIVAHYAESHRINVWRALKIAVHASAELAVPDAIGVD